MSLVKNDQAFTLIEVMTAMLIFALFATAFVTSMGYNVTTSEKMKLESELRNACEYKINEIIENPPEFREALTLKKDSGDFKEKELSDMKYEIEYKKFLIPDLAKIKGNAEGDEDANESQMETKLFETIKKNMEKMLWHVEVRVIHKPTEQSMSLSTWLYDPKVEIQIQGL
jgi:prepilin-type N-terminal cleavage/methylation domain-containing protein